MTLQEKLTMLPGRIAILTDTEFPQESGIKVPDWVVAKMRNLGLPPHHLIKGEIVAIGYSRPQKGRRGVHPDDFKVGDTVAAFPLEGRIIDRHDEDHPDWSHLIPEGKQLRLYGALQDANEQVLIKL
jgi:co-chaperonin GroES (HSP10)